tara:strand:+ start:67 stop:675 length:609 start_codon:yes stop_codon:yes gene_type:complete
MNQLLMVFIKDSSKYPVKTRLKTSIGKNKSIWVYNQILKKTVLVLKNIKTDIAVFHYNSIISKNPFKNFSKWNKIQIGKNLGEKISNAFNWGFEKGYKKIIIIGSDLWDLNEEIINKGFLELNKNKVVIGPSIDGGYYLLGLNKNMPKIFEGVKWGTQSVLTETLKLLEHEPYILPELNDIDTFEDLITNPSLFEIYNNNFK